MKMRFLCCLEEKVMSRKVRNSIYSILLSFLLVCNFGLEVFAASQYSENIIDEVQLGGNITRLDCDVFGYNQFPEIVPYVTSFVDASITISFDSAGMYIGICTGMNGIASVVGVKDIEVHRKKLFGYEVVAVSDGGEAYNVTTGVCSLLYTGAVQGEKYRVVCTHYGDVDGYRELEADTDWVTCNY